MLLDNSVNNWKSICITSEAMQYQQAPLSNFDENLFR